MKMVPTPDGRCVSCQADLNGPDAPDESAPDAELEPGDRGDETPVQADQGCKSLARKIALVLLVIAMGWLFTHPSDSERMTGALDAIIGDPPEKYDMEGAAVLMFGIPAAIVFALSFFAPSMQRLFMGLIGAFAASYFALVMMFAQTKNDLLLFGAVTAFFLYFAFRGFKVHELPQQSSS